MIAPQSDRPDVSAWLVANRKGLSWFRVAGEEAQLPVSDRRFR